MKKTTASMETAVLERYAQGAESREADLCCPINYNPKYLEAIPREILEKDYGCGDPSVHIKEGDTVLDLGSGGGKIAYIASQVTGPRGRVIGVDFNDAMLSLARKYRSTVAQRLGYSNVEFLKGRIQDLALNLEKVADYLGSNPVRTLEDLSDLEAFKSGIRREEPLIADGSIDVIVSNCVLNLVNTREKSALIREMFRVLKRGGRIAVSDILSDEEVSPDMRRDRGLWTGCITGAFQESEFLKELEEAGFYGIRVETYGTEPYRVVESVEFRSVTVTAQKGKEGPCLDRNQAVLYRGPWKEVVDDDGHRLLRGQRMAVCDKTYHIYNGEPYARDIIGIEPSIAVPMAEARPFSCEGVVIRRPSETKKSGQTSSPTVVTSGPGTENPSTCC